MLPSREDMLKDTEEEMSEKLEKGIPLRHFHKMGSDQWGYYHSLCKMGNLSPIRNEVEMLYNDVQERRRHHLTSYKEDVYELLNGGKEYKRVV